MSQGGEREKPWHDECEVGCHDGIDHEVAHGLAANDAEHALIVAVDGNEFVVSVFLAGGACRESDAQHECLLQDEHEHAGQHRAAVAS